MFGHGQLEAVASSCLNKPSDGKILSWALERELTSPELKIRKVTAMRSRLQEVVNDMV